MYIVIDRVNARPTLSQKRTNTVVVSHSPALSAPNSTIVMQSVPKDTRKAGTKSDSVG